METGEGELDSAGTRGLWVGHDPGGADAPWGAFALQGGGHVHGGGQGDVIGRELNRTQHPSPPAATGGSSRMEISAPGTRASATSATGGRVGEASWSSTSRAPWPPARRSSSWSSRSWECLSWSCAMRAGVPWRVAADIHRPARHAAAPAAGHKALQLASRRAIHPPCRK